MPIPSDLPIPERKSAKDRAYLQIQKWIIDGTLQPEEKINDSELAEALGVSRTPIREALQLLNEDGFVAMKPGVVTQVTQVKPEDAVLIFPPLAALQALAAEIAAKNMEEPMIEELRNVNEQFTEAIQDGDYRAALKWDEKFHDIIVDSIRNPYISKTTLSLQSHVRRLFYHDSIILTEESIEEHDQIIYAMEKRDPETAAEVTRTNFFRPIDHDYPLR
ncbi:MULTISPECIES: GntR family transcriptional regulator [Sinobaca]|uniref:DNA-binding GntR family transcriptional regulator n=1 Tax=Sinobaca qinghaiensis TaxID=342944 RepID=A0A419V7T3_9BACL|nr:MULTISPECIES: GntR family transcriptional regulator [Sinobaca]RKD76008.1 DNA-binding GntR family transcriptional regulator [Sinobaca qinghaiensis]